MKAAATRGAPAAPPGRRERRKHATRRDLIRAARDLFSVKGLYESRVEEITERAGIAKGTLYKYFESKESLIRDVVAEGFGELERHIDGKLAGARGFPETIARLVEAHHEFFSANPDLMRILHQVRGLLKFHGGEWRPLRAVLAGHIDLLAERLRRADPEADRSLRLRREVSILLFGAVSGTLSVRVSIDPKTVLGAPPSAVTRAMVAMAVTFAARPSPPRRGAP